LNSFRKILLRFSLIEIVKISFKKLLLLRFARIDEQKGVKSCHGEKLGLSYGNYFTKTACLKYMVA
jgi:hypothetical protein